MLLKNKYVFILLSLFIIVTSITCTFATDVNANDTDIGTTIYTENDNSHITVNDIPNTAVDEDITISGELTDNQGKAITNSPVLIYADLEAYGDKESTQVLNTMVSTNNEGQYNYTYKANCGGKLNIKVNSSNPSLIDTTSTYINPKSTIVTMNCSKIIDIGNTFNITGRLTDGDGNILRYTSVGVLLRGTAYGEDEYKTYSKEYTRTDNDGYYSYELVPTLAGRFDISIYYPGYHYYGFNRTDKSVRVNPERTIITVDPIPTALEGENISITGRLTDSHGNPLRYTGVGVLNYNDKNYTKTDENGYYNFTHTLIDEHDTTTFVYYPGYHNYAYSYDWTSHNVITREHMALDYIRDVNIGSNTIISGILTTYDNKPLSNKLIQLAIDDNRGNNEICQILTDSNGIFTGKWGNNNSIYFTPKKVGWYDVIAYYAESDMYDFTGFIVKEVEDKISYTDIYQEDNNIVIKGYITVSEENKKFNNNFMNSMQCNLTADTFYHNYYGVVSQPNVNIDSEGNFNITISSDELYLPNEHNSNLVDMTYFLNNKKSINGPKIALLIDKVNNKIKLTDYFINGTNLIASIDYDGTSDDVSNVTFRESLESTFDFILDDIKLEIYNQTYDENMNKLMPKQTVYIKAKSINECYIAFTFNNTFLKDFSDTYNPGKITSIAIHSEYYIDNLLLTNDADFSYMINGDKISFKGSSWSSGYW